MYVIERIWREVKDFYFHCGRIQEWAFSYPHQNDISSLQSAGIELKYVQYIREFTHRRVLGIVLRSRPRDRSIESVKNIISSLCYRTLGPQRSTPIKLSSPLCDSIMKPDSATQKKVAAIQRNNSTSHLSQCNDFSITRYMRIINRLHSERA